MRQISNGWISIDVSRPREFYLRQFGANSIDAKTKSSKLIVKLNWSFFNFLVAPSFHNQIIEKKVQTIFVVRLETFNQQWIDWNILGKCVWDIEKLSHRLFEGEREKWQLYRYSYKRFEYGRSFCKSRFIKRFNSHTHWHWLYYEPDFSGLKLILH